MTFFFLLSNSLMSLFLRHHAQLNNKTKLHKIEKWSLNTTPLQSISLSCFIHCC